ncbi:hypothetical protein P3W85_24625 [Cupriavidus basilensis]|uniref:Uncharacterized protein n=1 Tax=Cupriavidus basilensis TaxID=68895 RepID=A0ABT6AV04_9BURK|nr:hypothetical protein [Cupriavidus basilensis]MDF3836112.1 hypothetical protein [Cupriavidus basilensis]
MSSPTGIASRVPDGATDWDSREKFSGSDMEHGRASGVKWTCPQHNPSVKPLGPDGPVNPQCRMNEYKPLILMPFPLSYFLGNVSKPLMRQRLTGRAPGLFTKLSTGTLDNLGRNAQPVDDFAAPPSDSAKG